MDSFGVILEKELVENDLSMVELSRRLGKPESTLRKIHQGESEPTLRSLLEMIPRMSDSMYGRLLGMLNGKRHRRMDC